MELGHTLISTHTNEQWKTRQQGTMITQSCRRASGARRARGGGGAGAGAGRSARSPCSFFSVSQNFCSSVKYLSRMNTLERPSVAMAGGALASHSAAAPLRPDCGDLSRARLCEYWRAAGAAARPCLAAPTDDTYFRTRSRILRQFGDRRHLNILAHRPTTVSQ